VYRRFAARTVMLMPRGFRPGLGSGGPSGLSIRSLRSLAHAPPLTHTPHMGSRLCRHLVHIVFSTKDRQPFITGAVAPRLHAYLGGIARNRDCTAIAVGGVEDHVHLLIALHPTIALADIVRDLKANSSKWIHEDVGAATFAWQSGYGAFSVSRSNADAVTAYIHSQPDHHATRDFRVEFIALLDKHGVAHDERYVFA